MAKVTKSQIIEGLKSLEGNYSLSADAQAVVDFTLDTFKENPRDIHQIAKNQISKTMLKRDIREKLQNIIMLNNIYDKLKNKVNNNQIPDEDGDLTTSDFEFWESDDIFERRRKPIYMNVYKEIIKKK